MTTIKLMIPWTVDVRRLVEAEVSETIGNVIVAILVNAHEIDPGSGIPPLLPAPTAGIEEINSDRTEGDKPMKH